MPFFLPQIATTTKRGVSSRGRSTGIAPKKETVGSAPDLDEVLSLGGVPPGGRAKGETSLEAVGVQRRFSDSSGALSLGPGRRNEGGRGGKGDEQREGTLGNTRAEQVVRPAHTHPLGKWTDGRSAGAGGNCGCSGETAGGCFPGKKRSQTNPAGVKFQHSQARNDITKPGTYTHTHTSPSAPQPPPSPNVAALPRG